MSLESSILDPISLAHMNTEINLVNTPIIELSYEDECRLFSSTDIGDENADIYIWEASSECSAPERISNFIVGKGGDALQLIGIDPRQAGQYLAFSFDGKNTVLSITCASNREHKVILEDIDLTVLGKSDDEIIQALISRGNLDLVSTI